jgi:hypothetical protein
VGIKKTENGYYLNPDTTCIWTGKLKDAEEHHKQCPFVRTNCPHSGCKERIVRQALPEHIKRCLFRKWCSLSAAIRLIDLHLPACSKRSVLCPNGYIDTNEQIRSIPYDNVLRHRKICIFEMN